MPSAVMCVCTALLFRILISKEVEAEKEGIPKESYVCASLLQFRLQNSSLNLKPSNVGKGTFVCQPCVCASHCFSLDFKTQVSISNELLRLCLKLCFEFSRKSHTHTTLSGDTFFSASTYLEIEI